MSVVKKSLEEWDEIDVCSWLKAQPALARYAEEELKVLSLLKIERSKASMRDKFLVQQISGADSACRAQQAKRSCSWMLKCWQT